MRGNRHLKNGIYPALEPENGKKKPHGGHVRGHVNGIPRPLRSYELGLGMPPFRTAKTVIGGPKECPSVLSSVAAKPSSKSGFRLQAAKSRSRGDVFRSVFFAHNFMKHNQ